MTINKQALDMAGCTVEDYITWCKNNNKSSYKQSTKVEFFEKIADGRIVRDSQTGELINKRPRDNSEEQKEEN